MNRIKYFLVHILIMGTLCLQAQVFPPELICIKNDTLFWSLPTNTCGSFNSYQIFASQNQNGPYTNLATITNPNQTSYVDFGANLETWYYYMESDYDCPGETVLQSEILDNRLPQIAEIEAVSVDDGNIELTWTPSPSPEVSFYIIYRITTSGTIPIDTVFNGTTYIDTNAMPNTQEEYYYVLASDDCGNASVFDDPHHSVFMQSAKDPCSENVTLTWNPYEGWDMGIARHEVWVSIDGAIPIFVESIDANANTYVFENTNRGTEHCFFIKSIQRENPGIVAFSNTICDSLEVVNRDLFIKKVSVLPNQVVELDWTWTTAAAISSVRVLRSDDNTTYSEIFSETLTPPLAPRKFYTDTEAMPDEAPVFYQVEATNPCDFSKTSNTFSTIHLSGEPRAGDINFLTWTPPEVAQAEILNYELFHSFNQVNTSLALLEADQLSYEHQIDLSDFNPAQFCFFVEADIRLHLPDSTIETTTVRSNVTCVEQFPQILAPNAFTPTGKNPVFKPVLFFEGDASYQMVIYNRWGQLLFESTQAEMGWDGKDRSGRIAPQGVYIYQIRVTQENGHLVEKKGTVLLLN